MAGECYNLSPVDATNVRVDIFPDVANVPIKTASLDKGDLLYLPMYYWHHLQAGDGRNVALTYQFSRWIVPQAETHYSLNFSRMLGRYRVRSASSRVKQLLKSRQLLFNLDDGTSKPAEKNEVDLLLSCVDCTSNNR